MTGAGRDGRERRAAGRPVTPPARRPASGRRGRVRGGDDVGSDWDRAGRGRAAREGKADREGRSGERSSRRIAPRAGKPGSAEPVPPNPVPPGAVPVPRRPERAPGRRPSRGAAAGVRAPARVCATGAGGWPRRRSGWSCCSSSWSSVRACCSTTRPRERRRPHGHRVDHGPEQAVRDAAAVTARQVRSSPWTRRGIAPVVAALEGVAAVEVRRGVAAHRRDRGHRARPGRLVADRGGPVRGRHHRAVVPARARPAARAAPADLRRRRAAGPRHGGGDRPCSATSPSRCAPRWPTVAVAGTQVTLGLVDDRSVRWGAPRRSAARRRARAAPRPARPVYDVSSPRPAHRASVTRRPSATRDAVATWRPCWHCRCVHTTLSGGCRRAAAPAGPVCIVHLPCPGDGPERPSWTGPTRARLEGAAHDAPAQLPGRDQGRRHRWRRRQRRQPHDRGRAQGRRVHRGEHRRPGPADVRRRRQARHRPRAHPRPRRGREPRGRPQGRRGPPRGDRGGPQGGRHGLRHRGRGRWHRHRRRAGRRLHRPQARRADDRRGHPAVHLRGQAPRAGRPRTASPRCATSATR